MTAAKSGAIHGNGWNIDWSTSRSLIRLSVFSLQLCLINAIAVLITVGHTQHLIQPGEYVEILIVVAGTITCLGLLYFGWLYEIPSKKSPEDNTYGDFLKIGSKKDAICFVLWSIFIVFGTFIFVFEIGAIFGLDVYQISVGAGASTCILIPQIALGHLIRLLKKDR